MKKKEKCHDPLRTQLTEAVSLWQNSAPIVRFREAINQGQRRVWSGWFWPITGGPEPQRSSCASLHNRESKAPQNVYREITFRVISHLRHWSTNWGLSNVHIHTQDTQCTARYATVGVSSRNICSTHLACLFTSTSSILIKSKVLPIFDFRCPCPLFCRLSLHCSRPFPHLCYISAGFCIPHDPSESRLCFSKKSQ